MHEKERVLANKKKIRLILVSNHQTSLFMSAWFRQNKCFEESEIQTILVFAHLKVDDTYSEKSDEKTRINYECCRASWNDFNFQWITFQPETYFYLGSIKDSPFREYQKRKKAIHAVKSWLSRISVHPGDVYEIWHSNELLDIFLFYLCTNAKEVSFEHGIGEVHFQLSLIKPIPFQRPMWRYLEQDHLSSSYLSKRRTNISKIISFFRYITEFIFSLIKGPVFSIPNQLHKRVHVSLLADEIRLAGSTIPQGTIDPLEVKCLIEQVMQNDESISRLSSLEGNIAVILLSQIKFFALSSNDHLEYFQDLEKYILRDWAELFEHYNIKHIVFKTQLYHEDFFSEAFEGYSALKNKYQIHNLAKYSENNFNTEFYLPTLKPTLLIGAYSSGLFYAKKLYPNIKTLTYHDWFIDYTMRRYHNTYSEHLIWCPTIRNLFEVNFGYIFRPILPEKAPYTTDFDVGKRES